MNISELIDEIKASKKYENQIVHIENVSQRKAIYKEIELEPLIKFALSEKGIEKLYGHQAETIEYLRNGENVVLSTGTASGKSMTYMIPIFEEIIKNPYSTAIYISPLNALINDQLNNFLQFRNTMGIEININKYTGKMSSEERRSVKYGNPQIIFTNPEMLHGSILGWNKQWKQFISNLKLVVIDESHYYRGVIGSNMANILRRFNRVCDFYGSSPQYICCTATIGNPLEHSSALTGKKLKVVMNNCSSSGEQKFVFWNPPNYLNRQGFTDRKSSLTESTELFTTFVQKGLQTIAFTKARQKVEKMYKITQNELNKRGANARIMPYRSGYLSEERETIEKQLSESVIQGVISTNALELGIDIGNLDACILDGYPGTVMSTRQRAGRAGRSENESIVVLVAGSDALDQYYMRNPREFFNRDPEVAVLNVYNKYIQMGHILCAAKEIPLTKKDIHYFGDDLFEVVEALEVEKLLEGDEKKICLKKDAHMLVSIRSADKNNYTMLLEGTKYHKIEEGIERSQAFRECFEGSVYFHMGISYIVKKVDHDKRLIYVTEDSSDYYTRPKINSEISIVDVFDRKNLLSCNEIKVGFGSVDVTEQVVGYKKFQYFTDKEMEEEILSMPPYRLNTEAMWLELPDRFKELVENSNRNFEGGIHAIEHAMIGIYPLHLLVDRNDLGGVSTSEYTEFNGKGSIFIYDGHRGGVGYAESGYEGIVELLKATLKSIEECPCKEGCPSCIQSPKCGNNNNPLDKDAARMILHEMLGLTKYIPLESEKQKVLESSLNSKRIETTKNNRNGSKNDAEDALNRTRRKLKIHERKSVEEWIKLGQTTESHNIAYKYFEMALKKEPDNLDALFNIGIASLNSKLYRKALGYFNKLIDIGYGDWEIWTYKGMALDYLHRYEEAVEAYEEALKTKKDDPEIIRYKLSAERRLGVVNDGIGADNEILTSLPVTEISAEVNSFPIKTEVTKIKDKSEILKLIEFESSQMWVYDSIYHLENSKKYRTNQTSEITYEYLGKERNVSEIAMKRCLTVETITTHLIALSIKGREIPFYIVDNEIPLSLQLKILNGLKINGLIHRKLTKELLGEDCTYHQIDLMIALLISYNKKRWKRNIDTNEILLQPPSNVKSTDPLLSTSKEDDGSIENRSNFEHEHISTSESCCVELELDFTKEIVIQCVNLLKSKLFGINYIVNILQGKNSEKISANLHDSLPVFGLLKEHNRKQIEQHIIELIDLGYLRNTGGLMPKICLEQKGLNHLARKDVHTFKQKCTLPIEIKTSTNYISIEESQIEEKTSESPVLDSLNKYDKNDGLILGMDSTKEKSYSVDDIRKDYPNAYMPWEENEELELIKLYMSGTSIKEISSIIGRKESGIRSRLRKLNLH